MLVEEILLGAALGLIVGLTGAGGAALALPGHDLPARHAHGNRHSHGVPLHRHHQGVRVLSAWAEAPVCSLISLIPAM